MTLLGRPRLGKTKKKPGGLILVQLLPSAVKGGNIPKSVVFGWKLLQQWFSLCLCAVLCLRSNLKIQESVNCTLVCPGLKPWLRTILSPWIGFQHHSGITLKYLNSPYYSFIHSFSGFINRNYCNTYYLSTLDPCRNHQQSWPNIDVRDGKPYLSDNSG